MQQCTCIQLCGQALLTQYWVRRVKEQAYGGVTPDLGYGGHDEDQGQMGGVSALMAIGLFDVMGNESQQPVYEITSPIFDEITIKLDKRYYTGDQFVIRTMNNSAANTYIQQAKLNGENWNSLLVSACRHLKKEACWKYGWEQRPTRTGV